MLPEEKLEVSEESSEKEKPGVMLEDLLVCSLFSFCLTGG